MAKQETAEQKLLKMIESSTPGADQAQAKKKVAKKQSLLSILRLLNRGLFVALIVAVLFLGWEIKSGIVLLNQDITVGAKAVTVSPRTSALENEDDNNLDDYLMVTKRRNIFEAFKEIKTQTIIDVTGENKAIVKKTSGFKLVGISWLDKIETASVMIEDSNKGVTHVLRKGEKVGDIEVITIYADSVELGYNNEEIIIRYDQKHL